MTPEEVKRQKDAIDELKTRLVETVLTDINKIVRDNGCVINVEKESKKLHFNVDGYGSDWDHICYMIEINDTDDVLLTSEDGDTWIIADLTDESLIDLHAYLYRIGMATRPVLNEATTTNA